MLGNIHAFLIHFYSFLWTSQIAGLPHVEVEFSMTGSDFHKNLFMVDTGAGGAGVMFLSRAQKDQELLESLKVKCKKS